MNEEARSVAEPEFEGFEPPPWLDKANQISRIPWSEWEPTVGPNRGFVRRKEIPPHLINYVPIGTRFNPFRLFDGDGVYEMLEYSPMPTKETQAFPKRRKHKSKISNRKRFKVLSRDSFACRYCGRKPPDVELHIDHINPTSKGGSSDIENLATSCSDCNTGKGAGEI